MNDIEILEIMINALEMIEVDDRYNYETGETYYVIDSSYAIRYLTSEIESRKSN